MTVAHGIQKEGRRPYMRDFSHCDEHSGQGQPLLVAVDANEEVNARNSIYVWYTLLQGRQLDCPLM